MLWHVARGGRYPAGRVASRGGRSAKKAPGDIERAEERFGRTVCVEERAVLGLHVTLCLGARQGRQQVEGKAKTFFEPYPTSRWRKPLERELGEPPLRAR